MISPELELQDPLQGNQPVLERKRSASREWRAFWKNPLARFGVGGLLFLVLFTFAGPLFYHASAYQPNLLSTLQPPSAKYPLGTDSLGRDYLARMMLGGQLSLEVGFAAALMTTIIGVIYGLTAGLIGGAVDSLMMRLVDIFIAIPSLFLLLFVDSVFRPSAILLVIIIAVLSWFGVARLVRSEVLSLKRRDYVEAARALGATNWRIMIKHLLPNVMGVVIVNATFQVADAILTVAALSFLGLGLPPPTPNWGEMLSSSMSYMFQNAWWLIYPPGLAILLVELSVNFIGDALRQAFDPRLRKSS
ncbi:ABC transporter permease [Sulfobacillus thermosulfidooxidans]|uniref:Peptide/nickel transport system permease protein n=1 Tax=Sulfobacillus thermosulfidooxidans (strain DSM 9293 / VKM B-1269 / AT-1) TaxID=929705 RepID=A0A1W1WJR9_SULTA|nr:ABC transporter permease [Sulfobacillus thermosulfidooxidans]OLZ12227.1 peptide ABC transporter permease [Sulfobacillus thermosulfidooxidans]OLZ12992.1 peptide ABC transporter permease [Sulfobacillus thermosulfidooxidans]OLZ21793.1 peptide ABC transporter permease [Sulfobacillus thermosulfidooxidans]SMC06496.1 peptide/nickel transport system permease protein [Sulfobacillus thermosulfidooxidans DSM 9293]